MTKFYVECECTTPDHETIFTLDNKTGELYIYTQLRRQSFLKRLAAGIRYILGAKSSTGTGHWEETVLNREQVSDLTQKLITNINVSSLSNRGRQKLIEG